jgi:hypothetical protein
MRYEAQVGTKDLPSVLRVPCCREEEAVLRLTEDAGFKRRVMGETGTYTPTTIGKQAATPQAAAPLLHGCHKHMRNSTHHTCHPTQLTHA